MDILDELNKKLGVLVTSHPKQHKWMDQAFQSWAGYPGFMLLGYDHTDIDDLPLCRWMPPVDEYFVTGKPAGYYGHYRGELWQMKLGAELLRERGYEYIYKTAADNTCYRWRNLKRIFKVLNGKGKPELILCGTTQMFARIDTFCRMMDLWSDKITKCGGAECFINHQLDDLKIRNDRRKILWWNELLGLVHLQGEYAANKGITIFDTWAVGQKWGDSYKHRDLEPRLKFLKPDIRRQYESYLPTNAAASR